MKKEDFVRLTFLQALALTEKDVRSECAPRWERTGVWHTLADGTTLLVEWDRLLGAISVQLCGTDAVLSPEEGLYDAY